MVVVCSKFTRTYGTCLSMISNLCLCVSAISNIATPYRMLGIAIVSHSFFTTSAHWYVSVDTFLSPRFKVSVEYGTKRTSQYEGIPPRAMMSCEKRSWRHLQSYVNTSAIVYAVSDTAKMNLAYSSFHGSISMWFKLLEPLQLIPRLLILVEICCEMTILQQVEIVYFLPALFPVNRYS